MPPIQGSNICWWVPYPGRRWAVPWAILLPSLQDSPRSDAENYQTKPSPSAQFKVSSSRFKVARSQSETPNPKLETAPEKLRNEAIRFAPGQSFGFEVQSSRNLPNEAIRAVAPFATSRVPLPNTKDPTGSDLSNVFAKRSQTGNPIPPSKEHHEKIAKRTHS